MHIYLFCGSFMSQDIQILVLFALQFLFSYLIKNFTYYILRRNIFLGSIFVRQSGLYFQLPLQCSLEFPAATHHHRRIKYSSQI